MKSKITQFRPSNIHTNGDLSTLQSMQSRVSDALSVKLYPSYYRVCIKGEQDPRQRIKHIIISQIGLRSPFKKYAGGHGIGTRIFSQLVIGAEKLGYKQIRCIALGTDGRNGHYTWPRLGFNYELDTYDIELCRRLGITDAQGHSPKSVLDIMDHEEGLRLWRNQQEIRSFAGTFHTVPNSRSRQVLERYQRLRGIHLPPF